MRIAVASGKGGTGKTTIAIALAKLFAERYKTALVDLDISMINVRDGLSGEIDVGRNYLIPAKEGNLEYVYYDASKRSQITWDYGDYKDTALQLIEKTRWNSPDHMILDLPPGIDEVSREILPTSDCIILVVQPHEYSVSNTYRVIEFCRDFSLPVAGAILNFAWITCPSCHHKFRIFGERPNLEIPIIAEVPACNPTNVSDYLDFDKILDSINNPTTLKKRSTLRSKLLKLAAKGGFL